MKEKFMNGIKKYRSYLFSALAIVMIVTLITISLVVSKNNNSGTTVVNNDSVKFVLPVANATISMGYDAEQPQYNKELNLWKIHKGIDLVATAGDEVLACYAGKVSEISSNYVDGTTITITHENGLKSVYQGLSSDSKVKVGDMVETNQVLGTVAKVEDGEESHVHFELIKDGEKIDPLNYIEIRGKD